MDMSKRVLKPVPDAAEALIDGNEDATVLQLPNSSCLAILLAIPLLFV